MPCLNKATSVARVLPSLSACTKPLKCRPEFRPQNKALPRAVEMLSLI